MGLLGLFNRPRANGISLAGGSGASIAQAVQIIGAPDTRHGVALEYLIIEKLFGRRDLDWTLKFQMLDEQNGRQYDILSITLADGTVRTIHFDVTDFFGKGTDDLLNQLATQRDESSPDRDGGALAK